MTISIASRHGLSYDLLILSMPDASDYKKLRNYGLEFSTSTGSINGRITDKGILGPL